MKKVFTLILSSLILFNSVVFSTVEARSYRTKSSDVHIKSYTRKNGTKVKRKLQVQVEHFGKVEQ